MIKIEKYSSNTASPVIAADPFPVWPVDMLLRLRADIPHQRFNIVSATDTQTVKEGLSAFYRSHLQDISLLKSVIFWQRKTIEYQALHSAFLLNSLSEEEFEQESEKFTCQQHEIDPLIVASTVEKLDSLIGLRLDTSDYADYFHCTQDNVMSAIRLIKKPHFVEMLPALADD